MSQIKDLIGSTEFLAAIAGSIVGTLGSGIISWQLARQTAAETLRRDEADRIARDKAAALRISLKVTTITNGLHTVMAHINEGLDQAGRDGLLPDDVWKFVRSVPAATSWQVEFSAEDFAPLLALKRVDLINDAVLLAARWRELAAAFDAYSGLRRILQDRMAPYTKIDPATGLMVTGVPEGMVGTHSVAAHELEHLNGSIIDLGTEYENDANVLCDEMAKTFCSAYGSDFPAPALKKPVGVDDQRAAE